MNRKTRNLFAIVLCAVMMPTLTLSASSQGKSKGNHGDHASSNQGHSAAVHAVKNDHDDYIFSSRDRDSVFSYYRNADSNLPPGLAKRNGNLPPGLRKQLQRNGTLPPGLQRRMRPLNSDLERRLPVLSSDYSRGFIGQDIVVVNNRTQRIVDVIRDVIVLR